MSDYFNDTHEQVRQSARKFVATHVLPYIDDWEEAGEFPRELYKTCLLYTSPSPRDS